MTWLPTVLNFAVTSIGIAAAALCVVERRTIQRLLREFMDGPPDDKAGPRHWGASGR